MTEGQAEALLVGSLDVFVRAYEGNPALVAEQHGWSLVIALAATDAGAEVRLRLQDGAVVRDGDAEAAGAVGAAASAPRLIVSATLQTLRDVLELRCDANEPYLFGELTVTGPEADFLRLDYIASRLCKR